MSQSKKVQNLTKNTMLQKVVVGGALLVAGSVNAMAALVIDTTAINTDITTAGVAGLAIALSVAGIAIGVALVRKLIRA